MKGLLRGLAIGAFAATAAGAAPAATASCPNEGIRGEQSATFLAACRAYEKVSPEEKNANDINPFTSPSRNLGTVSSNDGNRVAYSSIGAFADSPSSVGFSMYLARRGSGGWATNGISPPQTTSTTNFSFGAVRGFSGDLSFAAVDSFDPPLTTDALPERGNLYARNLLGNSYSLLTAPTVENPAPESTPFYFAGASEDFSRVIFETSAPLTSDAPVGVATNLFESSASGVRLAAILPGETPANGSYAGPGGPTLGITASGATGGSLTGTAISRDGSKVFWSDAETGQLYARVNGSSTIHVSASRRSDAPGVPEPAIFRLATPDGDTVLFTSAQSLTEDSRAEPGATPKEDLYRFDLEAETLTDLSVPDGFPDQAEVLGVLGASSDADHVYFAAQGVLAEGGEAGPDLANIYLWHAGEISHLATVPKNQTSITNWATNPGLANGMKLSRVGAGGRVLLFAADVSLTGEETNGTIQLYRYDADADQLLCVSCDPTGAGSSEAFLGRFEFVAPATLASFEPNLLSADGSRIFFNTAEPLDVADSNGAVDVYEWRSAGTDGCAEGDGCQALISGGQSREDSFFAAASEDGSDAFFITRQRLLPSDRDSNLDLYDARIGGGFPTPTPPAPACEGETCQGPPAQAPASTTPATSLVQPHSKPAGERRKKKHKKRCGRKAKKRNCASKRGVGR